MKWDNDYCDGVFWIGLEAAYSLLGSMEKVLGIKFTEHIIYCVDKKFYWLTLEEENIKIGNFLIESFKDKGFLKKTVKGYQELKENTIKELDSLDKEDFSRYSKEGLFKALRKSVDLYIKNFDFGFIMEPVDFVMPELLNKKLKDQNYSLQEISDMIAIADTSFINREMQDLIKTQDLKKHAYDYRWLKSGHTGKIKIPLSYFEERKKELKEEELEELETFKEKTEKRKQELIEKKPVDEETQIFLGISTELGPLHDVRKELFLRTIYTIDTIREEIAKRISFTKDELTGYEADDIIKGNIDKKQAQELAKEALAYYNTKKGIKKIYRGKQAREFYNKEYKPDIKDIKQLEGMAACLGKAVGKVKIIDGVRDFKKMQKGDIIVTSMTRPEFVPVMKKASAIVTNEGGVTCHAAIVSRELNITCIIGTKVATQVLKDGESVEVDADKGVVRKL